MAYCTGFGWNSSLRRYYTSEVALVRDVTRGYIETFMPNIDKILEYINKEDSRFCKNPSKVGSYWQRLKVDKADEFDINIALAGIHARSWVTAGPCYYGFDQVTQGSHHDSYSQEGYQSLPNLETVPSNLRVVSRNLPLPPAPRGYTVFGRGDSALPIWMNAHDLVRDGDIVPFLVRRRLKELLTKAIRDLKLQGTVRQSRKVHGPALTLYINMGKKEVIVDLAPMIKSEVLPIPAWIGWPHQHAAWPDQQKVENIKKIGMNIVARKEFYWLLSFSQMEAELVKDIDKDEGCRKQAHMIMKKLNTDVWCNTPKPVISSYLLKNIWFWEIEKHPYSHDWAPDCLGQRVVAMIQKLMECIHQRQLSQYFYPDINLLDEKDEAELDITRQKIQQFLADPDDFFNNIV